MEEDGHSLRLGHAPRRGAPALFLDRDGTLIEDPGYLADPNGVHIIPGVSETLTAFHHAGYALVLVTNQSGIGRGYYNPKSVIDELHRKGRKVICYFDAGAWESYRPDADHFPKSVVGKPTGWEGERWLDIRQVQVIGPLIEARLDMAVAKGCDAVEPDQDNGWENDPGFPITREESIAWNIWVADAAHARGLSVGLKNSVTETAELEPYFDWNLNEECFQYQECELLEPFTRAGKAVLQVEYATDPRDFCPRASALGFASMRKNLELDAARMAC